MRNFFLVLLLAALTLTACDQAPLVPQFNAINVSGADFGKRLDLPDVSGQKRSLADWQGKIVLLFMGYTQCPDICPTALARAATLLKRLGNDANRVSVVFVTLDPERDTPALLAEYVKAFDPRITALRGNPVETAAAAAEFKVFYQRSAGKTANQYSIDHSTMSYVIDGNGRLRLLANHDLSVDALLADIRRLLAE